MRVPVYSHAGECYCETCRDGTLLADVEPSGMHPDSGRGDWRGTCPKCGRSQFLELVNPSYDPWADSDRVAEVLASLCRGGVVLGPGWSVGPYKTAVDGCEGCAVLDLRGVPAVVTLDLFEAAREFVVRVQREEASR